MMLNRSVIVVQLSVHSTLHPLKEGQKKEKIIIVKLLLSARKLILRFAKCTVRLCYIFSKDYSSRWFYSKFLTST